jgi:2,3,4,5-tetrahydropyridine-2,6-dicarboxylate N-succinyltransferase
MVVKVPKMTRASQSVSRRAVGSKVRKSSASGTVSVSSPEQLIARAFAGEIVHTDPKVKSAVEKAVKALDLGQLRVAEKKGDLWIVNQWLKQAILLYFRLHNVSVMKSGPLTFIDKVPAKKWTGKEGVRIVPQGFVRYGAFVESGSVVMPSFVNIGAYVGGGTMVDTWATVGSCAQIGKNVHLSGGVGIGGVLEPVQASPVIIEDNAFIGSRAIVVEGVVVEEGVVLGAGVVLTASTKIIDVTRSESTVYKGRVPKNSVVIPGMTEKEFPAGKFGVPCALIIGRRSESTNLKTSLTDALREFNVPV